MPIQGDQCNLSEASEDSEYVYAIWKLRLQTMIKIGSKGEYQVSKRHIKRADTIE